jgi:hypothetical protein
MVALKVRTGGSMSPGIINLLSSELNGSGSTTTLMVLLLGLFYHRKLLREDHPFSLSACVVSGFLSLLLLLGMSFSAFHSFEFLIGRKCQMVVAGIVFLGNWIVFYSLIKLLYELFDRLNIREYCPVHNFTKKLDTHFFLFSIITITVFWSLLEIWLFPGSVPHDGRRQLEMYFGYMNLTTHHPIVSTMLMGWMETIGEFLFGRGIGIIVYVLFQNIVGIVIFSSCCNYIRKKTSVLWGSISVLFFSVVPIWGCFAQAVMKDFLYSVMFAWFVLEYVKIFLRDRDRFSLIRLSLSSVLVCVLRNNGAYIVLPALFVLIFISCEKKKILSIVFALVFVADFGLNVILIDALKIEKGPKVEMCSIPLQQLARCAALYEDAFTEEEAQILDKVIRYEGVGERYDPECSDAVKIVYKSTTGEEWSMFWKIWMKKLKQYPIVYIEATLNNVFGYVDPFYFYKGLSAYPLYNKDSFGENDSAGKFSSYVFSDSVRWHISNYVYAWEKIPCLSLLMNPAFYTWVGIILLGAVLRKKSWKSTMVFVIPLLNVLICFASPVNGYLRYMLPVIAAMPLFALVGINLYIKR